MKQFQPHGDLNLIRLIEAVAEESGVSRADTSRVIRAMLDVVARTVSNLYRVRLTNFGTFAPRYVGAQLRRNPQTGAQVPVGEHYRPVFGARGKFYDGMFRNEEVTHVKKNPKTPRSA